MSGEKMDEAKAKLAAKRAAESVKGDAIFDRFLRAKAEFEPVAMDSKNPHFGNRYASLQSVKRSVDAALLRNGLTVREEPFVDGDNQMLRMVVTDGSDSVVSGAWFVAKVGTPPQQMGSALTYARRYLLQTVLGVVAETDDDGEQGQKPAAKQESEF